MATQITIRQCELCSSTDKLTECSGCEAVVYCCAEHEKEDVGHQEDICKAVQDARGRLRKEEKLLREMKYANKPLWVFEEGMGQFWVIPETRKYMIARLNFITQLLKINSYDAVTSAFEHVYDMLQLSRSDNLGLCNLAPVLLLRLGQDQFCYDMLKWYATNSNNPSPSMGNRFMNLTGEDIMEDPDLWIEMPGAKHSASHEVALTLLKLRLYLDLQAAQDSAATDPLAASPPSLTSIQSEFAFRSSIWADRPELLTDPGIDKRISVLETQLEQLFYSVKRRNIGFWTSLRYAERYLDEEIQSYGDGAETMILVRYFYRVWCLETMDTMNWVRRMLGSEDD